MRFGDSRDRIMIGRLAEQIDRNDRTRPEPELLGSGDGAFETRRVQIERLGIDIGEHRRRPA